MSALRSDLAPTIGGSAPVSSTSEQPPSARVVAFPKTDSRAGDQLVAGHSTADTHAERACGERFDLRFLAPFDPDGSLRERVSGLWVADADELANVLARELPRSQHRALLRVLIAERLTPKPAATRRRPERRMRSAKWGAVASSGTELDILRVLVLVNGESKPLGDCSREDVASLVGSARARVRVLARRARSFELLGEEMGRRGVELVGELPVEIVKRVLS